MSQSHIRLLRPGELLAIDLGRLLFSLTTFVAAALVLFVSFAVSLPRPWWALLTVYVTAQPMAGAFRPKVLYRLAGIAVGAVVTILVVPNMQNAPALLVVCLSIWMGICIYLAVLDRTPRAFLFQMAAFSTAVISFPYLYDPVDIFTTTISRVEEMTVAILCVTVTHMLFYPTSVRTLIHERAESFLAHASQWTTQALGGVHTRLEYENRRKLAADVTELGMIAVNLPFDYRYSNATRETITELQHRLAALIPLASAATDRLDRLRNGNALDQETEALVKAIVNDLNSAPDTADALDLDLIHRSRMLSARHLTESSWQAMLSANLCDRLAAFVETLHSARVLVRAIASQEASDKDAVWRRTRSDRTVPRRRSGFGVTTRKFHLARDHGLALIAGLATTTAIGIYCAVWVMLAWPSGSTTAAFAALITCSFAAQDDPAPAIGAYLLATLATFPLAALYLFVVLPRVDGAYMLIVTLAPALIWMGYLQADPARASKALPMLSCFIVAMQFLDRFQIDFAGFVNTGLAQVAGIVTTLAVTKLFRSTSARWTAYRMVHKNWDDLALLADVSKPLDAHEWTARATDRLGQIAARMAYAGPEDALHAVDGLYDLRIGRNVIQAREGLDDLQADTRTAIENALRELSRLYRLRQDERKAVKPTPSLVDSLDRAIDQLQQPRPASGDRLLLALVGMRCNLLPGVAWARARPS
ncbi:Fusaric acid resistance protein region (plasmid) [Pararobbsia alpina]|uniref:FUSC family protein n=1 Tax=Pararobbsia alpina TaxID=621374 RepID=UPI0039A4DCCB